MATEVNIVQKSGAWYSFNDERLGQGREQAKQFLKDHPDISKSIEQLIRQHFHIAGAVAPVSSGSADDEVFDFDE